MSSLIFTGSQFIDNNSSLIMKYFHVSGIWLCDDDEVLDGTINANPVDLGEGLKPPGYYVRRTTGLFPAPLIQSSEQCDRAVKHFWFLGIFLAKVLQDNRLVDLPLSTPFLKLLCQGEIHTNIHER